MKKNKFERECKLKIYIESYRDWDTFCVDIYFDNRLLKMCNTSFKDVVKYLEDSNIFEDNEVYLDIRGVGVGIADELDKIGVKYEKLIVDKIVLTEDEE